MTPAALLSSLESRGVAARIDGGELRLRPASALDARVLADVRAMKPQLVELLRARESAGREETEPSASTREYSRSFDAGAAYDPSAAREEAWRAFRANEVTSAQRDALLWYARAPRR
jgi:hypothetical protein